MRLHLQPGQLRLRWGAAVMPSLWILLVAQSCAAQTASMLGILRGTVTDSSGAVVEAAIVSLQAAGSKSSAPDMMPNGPSGKIRLWIRKTDS
jgi:hypothetical protein